MLVNFLELLRRTGKAHVAVDINLQHLWTEEYGGSLCFDDKFIGCLFIFIYNVES